MSNNIKIKYEILEDRIIAKRGRKKLYQFKVKHNEIDELFEEESEKSGGNRDEFLRVQIEYKGSL